MYKLFLIAPSLNHPLSAHVNFPYGELNVMGWGFPMTSAFHHLSCRALMLAVFLFCEWLGSGMPVKFTISNLLFSKNLLIWLFYRQDLVFAILIADNQLVTLCRMKKYVLHPAGKYLLVCSKTFCRQYTDWKHSADNILTQKHTNILFRFHEDKYTFINPGQLELGCLCYVFPAVLSPTPFLVFNLYS